MLESINISLYDLRTLSNLGSFLTIRVQDKLSTLIMWLFVGMETLSPRPLVSFISFVSGKSVTHS